MDFRQQLHIGQRLEQRLVMTQQLQAAIRLLQLSRTELVDSIHEALAENPLLEEAPPAEAPPDTVAQSLTSGEGQLADIEAPIAQRERTEIDWQSYFTDLARGPTEGTGNYAGSDEERPPLTQTLTRSSTLAEFLTEQLGTTELTPAERAIADDIVGNIDDDGYFRPSRLEVSGGAETVRRGLFRQAVQDELEPEELRQGFALWWLTDDEMATWQLLAESRGCCAESTFANSVRTIAHDHGCAPAEVVRVLEIVRGLDPPGVASRDLRECLLTQASQRHPQELRLHRLIADCLPLVEQRNHAQIRRDLRVQPEELGRLFGLLSSLEPRPGRGFEASEARYITPDVYVHKVGDDYTVVLNEDGMPRLRVSKYYQQALQTEGEMGSAGETARDYLQERLRAATWMIRSIHQRQSTIQRVTESIMRFQRGFLDGGADKLRPLVLREVAEDVGLHESTISRVTSNKYVHTPQGIYELKYFFNSRIQTAGGGDEVASEAVKQAIKRLIDKERVESPLSDQELAEILGGEWPRDQLAPRVTVTDAQLEALLPSPPMQVARRTVAKYRESSGLESSSRRRKAY
jgi:RNA polymerase sigma-54 factor